MKNFFIIINFLFLLLPFQSNAEKAPEEDTLFEKWAADHFIDPRAIRRIEVSPDGLKSLVFYYYTSEQSKDQYMIYMRCSVVDNTNKKILFSTHETDSCSEASWSPDGKWISLIYNSKDGSSLHLASTSDYQPFSVFKILMMAQMQWSPNSKKISFLARSSSFDSQSKDKEIVTEKNQISEYVQLYVAEINPEENKLVLPYFVTPKELNVTTVSGKNYSWAPDSEKIAFSFLPTTSQLTYNETNKLRIGIVNINSGEIEYIKTSEISFNPAFSPDGRRLAYTVGAAPIKGENITRDDLYVGALKACILDLKNQTKQCLAETPNKSSKIVGWYGDGSAILVQDHNKTRNALYKLPVNGQEALLLPTDKIGNVEEPFINSSGTYVGFRGESFFNAAEAFVSPLEKFNPVQATDFHKGFPKTTPIKVETIQWTSSDGEMIEGFLFYPAGYEKGQKVPLLTILHGGPIGVWQERYLGDPGGSIISIPLLASQGIAVFEPNVRGSDGYGLEFRQSIYKDWGGKPFKDLMTGIDAIIEKGVADPERLVISGWSYGGYLTAWAIGHTDRFKVAILGAAPINLISEQEKGATFENTYYGGYFWKNYKAYLDSSPLMYVENIKTPTLIQQGEYDQTVPQNQAYELYNALKQRGVPVKMTIYKNQGHSFSAPAALPALREIYFWMDQHGLLKKENGEKQ